MKRNRLIFVISTLLLTAVRFLTAQTPSVTSARPSPSESVCKKMAHESAVQAALRLVCRQGPVIRHQSSQTPIIVVGFVGGFANPQDRKHPEVLFADYLREHYGSDIHAQVFSNHDDKGALRYVARLLDGNHDGSLSDEERGNARIIIYGHSWGASETATFARELGRQAIPVLLTIQVDIIPKFRQKPFRIPPNVGSAINFYQSEGLLQGQPEIIASDAARTSIIGNFRLTYRRKPLNCDNYPWMARTFNKPHHEIENDPNVWDNIATLIEARVYGGRSRLAEAPAPNGRNASSTGFEDVSCCFENIAPARP